MVARAALVTVVAVFVMVGLAVAFGEDEPPPPARFGVLDRPPDPATDTLPATEGTVPRLVAPGSARFVGTLGDARAFLARGRDGGLCAFLVQGASIGGGCSEPGGPGYQPSYTGTPAGERVALLIPVPDHVAVVQVDDRTLTPERNAVLTTITREEGRGRPDELPARLPRRTWRRAALTPGR